MDTPDSALQNLTARVRDLSGLTMSETEATEAARNFAKFFSLLSKIDEEQGSEHGCNGSRCRVRQT